MSALSLTLICLLRTGVLSPAPGRRYALPPTQLRYFHQDPRRGFGSGDVSSVVEVDNRQLRPTLRLSSFPPLSVDSLPSYSPPLFSPAFPLAERPTHYVLRQRLTGNRNTRSNLQDCMDSGIWSLPPIRPRVANRITIARPYYLQTSRG
jgi:hypothetical protein